MKGRVDILWRFFLKVDKTDTCWLWTGSTTKGTHNYGEIHVDGRTERAHCIAYRLFIDPIPDGLDVLHKCDVPRCVNPEHLFLGTAFDNAMDMVSKGRDANVVFLGTMNGNAKLTEQDVREIRSSKESVPTLARLHNVGETTIRLIRNRKTWRHVI